MVEAGQVQQKQQQQQQQGMWRPWMTLSALFTLLLLLSVPQVMPGAAAAAAAAAANVPLAPSQANEPCNPNMPSPNAQSLGCGLDKRERFYSWGGKRSSPAASGTPSSLPPALRKVYLALLLIARCGLDKREGFNPWEGKGSASATSGAPSSLPPALSQVYFALFQNARLHCPTISEDLYPIFAVTPPLARGDQNNVKKNAYPPSDYLTQDFHVPTTGEDQVPDVTTNLNDINKWGFSSTPTWEEVQETYPLASDVLDEELWKSEEPPVLFGIDTRLPLPAADLVRYKRQTTSEPSDDEAPESIKGSRTKREAENVKPMEDNRLHDAVPSEAKRIRFSAWAGKRSIPRPVREEVRQWGDYRPQLAQRRGFSAWAGKRSEDTALNNDHEKRTFSAWAGKRSGKDSAERANTTKPAKPAFYIWGKRSSGRYDRAQDVFTAADNPPTDQTLRLKRTFSAWAGKRANVNKRASYDEYVREQVDPEIGEDYTQRSDNSNKRQAFSAWAGKRGDSTDEQSDNSAKRQAFSAWAGKRNENEAKRQAFSAWAGKRSDADEKRQAFSAWAGKRSDADEKRQAFSAWAGKRSDGDVKRQPFSAWAGKRSDPDARRQAFSAWAGKRSDADEKRQAFSAWAGKRSDEDGFDENTSKHIADFLQHERQSSELMPYSWAGKRVPFSAWAGKRSDLINSQTSDSV